MNPKVSDWIIEDAVQNAIDMVAPLPKTAMFYNSEARWFVEVLWYNDELECWVRSWAHHQRKLSRGDVGFQTLQGAFDWACQELRGYLFYQGRDLPSFRVRFYWSDQGPSLHTRTIVEMYDLGVNL